MTGQPVKYFEHYTDGGRCLAIHRLDELVMVTLTHGRDDESPDVVFFGPTAGHHLAGSVESAARDAKAVFDRSRPHPGGPGPDAPPPGDLPPWGPAFAFGGLPLTDCPAGDGQVGCGQSARVETATGRIWHDDCAEDAGATTPLTPASAPSDAASTPASDGAHGAAGGLRSAVAGRPAAPNPDPLTSASAPLAAPFGEVGDDRGADGAAGADRASAVPCRPAAPTTSRRS